MTKPQNPPWDRLKLRSYIPGKHPWVANSRRQLPELDYLCWNNWSCTTRLQCAGSTLIAHSPVPRVCLVGPPSRKKTPKHKDPPVYRKKNTEFMSLKKEKLIISWTCHLHSVDMLTWHLDEPWKLIAGWTTAEQRAKEKSLLFWLHPKGCLNQESKTHSPPPWVCSSTFIIHRYRSQTSCEFKCPCISTRSLTR